jgi:hypothetical protein
MKFKQTEELLLRRVQKYESKPFEHEQIRAEWPLPVLQ